MLELHSNVIWTTTIPLQTYSMCANGKRSERLACSAYIDGQIWPVCSVCKLRDQECTGARRSNALWTALWRTVLLRHATSLHWLWTVDSVDLEAKWSQLTPGSLVIVGSFSFRISEVHLMHLTHLVHQAGEASLHQLSHEETSPRNQPAGFEWFAMGLEFERAHVIPCHWVIPRCRVIFFVFRLSGIGTGTSVHIHLGLQRHATSRLSTEGWPQKPRIASTRTEL